MFKDAFVKLEPEEAEKILQEVNPVLEGGGFNPATATILSFALSFYPGRLLLDIADHSLVPAPHRLVIYRPGEVTVLDGTNGPLYKLNAAAPVLLDKNNIIDYVRFFFSAVRGRHGRFMIAENVDDIAWREEPPAAARKAISHTLAPLSVQGKTAGGDFRLKAQMIFKDSLFRTGITVSPEGFITLSDEELLVENMPVLDETLGQ